MTPAEIAGRLTPTQWRGLNELRAACDDAIRYHPHRDGWTRTGLLSGTRQERSAANMRSLVALGLAEGSKPKGEAQTQWSWRITEAGRRALAAWDGGGA